MTLQVNGSGFLVTTQYGTLFDGLECPCVIGTCSCGTWTSDPQCSDFPCGDGAVEYYYNIYPYAVDVNDFAGTSCGTVTSGTSYSLGTTIQLSASSTECEWVGTGVVLKTVGTTESNLNSSITLSVVGTSWKLNFSNSEIPDIEKLYGERPDGVYCIDTGCVVNGTNSAQTQGQGFVAAESCAPSECPCNPWLPDEWPCSGLLEDYQINWYQETINYTAGTSGPCEPYDSPSCDGGLGNPCWESNTQWRTSGVTISATGSDCTWQGVADWEKRTSIYGSAFSSWSNVGTSRIECAHYGTSYSEIGWGCRVLVDPFAGEVGPSGNRHMKLSGLDPTGRYKIYDLTEFGGGDDIPFCTEGSPDVYFDSEVAVS